MPTYEYNCPHCGTDFDKFCKISERAESRCPECDNIGRQVVRTPVKPHWTSLAMGESVGPEAIRMFDKMRRDKKAKEEKAIKEHGSIS